MDSDISLKNKENDPKVELIWKRAVKLILYSVVILGTFYQCFEILDQYYQFEKIISVEVIESIEFPAVTICN